MSSVLWDRRERGRGGGRGEAQEMMEVIKCVGEKLVVVSLVARGLFIYYY